MNIFQAKHFIALAILFFVCCVASLVMSFTIDPSLKDRVFFLCFAGGCFLIGFLCVFLANKRKEKYTNERSRT